MTIQNKATRIEIGGSYLSPEGIGSNDLSFDDCIAEIIANSIDWRITLLDQTLPTRIRVNVGINEVSVIDNGAGMTLEELDTAINLSESNDQIRAKLSNEERKGMYGLGLKIAALSLGWKFKVSTVSHLNPEVECQFEYNSKKVKSNNSDYLKKGLFIKHGPRNEFKNSPLKSFKTGTAITIELLERDKKSCVPLGKILEDRFAPNIRSLDEKGLLDFEIADWTGSVYQVRPPSLEGKFEDEVLKLDFENPNKWAKKKEYIYTGHDGKEYRLRGFLQLLKQRSVSKQEYGLNLYCKGQLIERFHKKKDVLFPIAGRAGEKAYGELHLDGCRPDNVKARGFINDKSLKEVRSLLEDDLQLYKNLGGTSGKAKDKILKEINKRKGLGQAIRPSEEPTNPDNKDPENETPNDEIDLNLPENTITIDKKLHIHINPVWVHEKGLSNDANYRWEPYYEKSSINDDLYNLQVYINPDSVAFKELLTLYSNKKQQQTVIDLFKKIGICECINECLITHHNYSPEDARYLTDTKAYPFVIKMKLE